MIVSVAPIRKLTFLSLAKEMAMIEVHMNKKRTKKRSKIILMVFIDIYLVLWKEARAEEMMQIEGK